MASDTIPAAAPGPAEPARSTGSGTTPAADPPANTPQNWLASLIEPVEPARPHDLKPVAPTDVAAPGAVSPAGLTSADFHDAEKTATKDATGEKRKTQGSVWKALGLALAQRWAKGGGTANKRLDLQKAKAQANQLKENRTTTTSSKSEGLSPRGGSGGGSGAGGDSKGPVKTPPKSSDKTGSTPRNVAGTASGPAGRGSAGPSGGGGRGPGKQQGSGGGGKPGGPPSGGQSQGAGRSGSSGGSGKDGKAPTAGKGGGGKSGSDPKGSSGGGSKGGGATPNGKGSGGKDGGSVGKGADSGAGSKNGGSGAKGADLKKNSGSGDTGKQGTDGKKAKDASGKDSGQERTPLQKSREIGHGDGTKVRGVVDHVRAYKDGVKDGWGDEKDKNAKEHDRLDKAHDKYKPKGPAAKDSAAKEPTPKDAKNSTTRPQTPGRDAPGPENAAGGPIAATTRGQTITITDGDNEPMEDPFMSQPTPIQAKGIDGGSITLGGGFLKSSVSRGELRTFKQYEGRLQARIGGLSKVTDETKALAAQARQQADDCQKLAEQAKGVKGGAKLIGKLNKLADQAKSQADEADQIHKKAVKAHDFAHAVLSNIRTRYTPLYQAVVDSDETKPAELKFYADRGVSPSDTALAA